MADSKIFLYQRLYVGAEKCRYLEVPVDHTFLVAVLDTLKYLLDAHAGGHMYTACACMCAYIHHGQLVPK